MLSLLYIQLFVFLANIENINYQVSLKLKISKNVPIIYGAARYELTAPES